MVVKKRTKTLHRLDWRNLQIYCNASAHKKQKIAKWHNNGIFYCKHCAKRHWGKTALLAGKYKRNRKTVTTRVLALRTKATKAERIFRSKLQKAINVKFSFQRGFIKGGYYAIVDFHIPSRKLCIEIDGGYHNDPEQRKRDKKRDNWLTNVRGQRVIRLTNEQATAMSVVEIGELVA